MTTKRKANPTDVYIGKQIRKARELKWTSQSDLADALGVSFQQVQKYEKASNRVSCGKLLQIANFFELPILYFFPVQGDEQVGTIEKLMLCNEMLITRIEMISSISNLKGMS